MEMYTGKSIFKGIAIGKILFYQKGEQPVKRENRRYCRADQTI